MATHVAGDSGVSGPIYNKVTLCGMDMPCLTLYLSRTQDIESLM